MSSRSEQGLIVPKDGCGKVIHFPARGGGGGADDDPDDFKATVNLLRVLGLERLFEQDEMTRVVKIHPFSLEGNVKQLKDLSSKERLRCTFSINAWSLATSCPVTKIRGTDSRNTTLHCALCSAEIYKETKQKCSDYWTVGLPSDHLYHCGWKEPVVCYTNAQKLRMSAAIHSGNTAKQHPKPEGGLFFNDFERSLIVTLRALVGSPCCGFFGKDATPRDRFFQVCRHVFRLENVSSKFDPNKVMREWKQQVTESVVVAEKLPDCINSLVESIYHSPSFVEYLRRFVAQAFEDFAGKTSAQSVEKALKAAAAKKVRKAQVAAVSLLVPENPIEEDERRSDKDSKSELNATTPMVPAAEGEKRKSVEKALKSAAVKKVRKAQAQAAVSVLVPENPIEEDERRSDKDSKSAELNATTPMVPAAEGEKRKTRKTAAVIVAVPIRAAEEARGLAEEEAKLLDATQQAAEEGWTRAAAAREEMEEKAAVDAAVAERAGDYSERRAQEAATKEVELARKAAQQEVEAAWKAARESIEKAETQRREALASAKLAQESAEKAFAAKEAAEREAEMAKKAAKLEVEAAWKSARRSIDQAEQHKNENALSRKETCILEPFEDAGRASTAEQKQLASDFLGATQTMNIPGKEQEGCELECMELESMDVANGETDRLVDVSGKVGAEMVETSPTEIDDMSDSSWLLSNIMRSGDPTRRAAATEVECNDRTIREPSTAIAARKRKSDKEKELAILAEKKAKILEEEEEEVLIFVAQV